MKIGIDARFWNETGVGRYIRGLVDNLQIIDKKNQYFIYLLEREYNQIQLSQNFHKVKTQISWHSLAEQVLLPSFYKKFALDLVHVPYFSVPIFTPKPFIFTLHDLTISRFATGRASSRSRPIYFLKWLAYKQVLRQAIFGSQKIIVPSETVKKELIATYPHAANKVKVIYESGELENIHQGSTVRENNYLLYVGNAHPHKNLEKLLLAFKLLVSEFSDLKLVLIGKEDFFYKRLHKEMITAELSDKVKIYSNIDNSSLGSWYKNAICLVFPSLSEGFGIPGLEAMWQKCPVVASDIEVFHEIYGSAAHYFDPYDSQDIARKIKAVMIDTKLRQHLIRNGTARAQTYSWKRMAIQTLAIYESCVSL